MNTTNLLVLSKLKKVIRINCPYLVGECSVPVQYYRTMPAESAVLIDTENTVKRMRVVTPLDRLGA